LTATHPGVWALWGVAAVVSIQVAPNPVYVAAVLGSCGAVVLARGRPGPLARAFPMLLVVGAAFALIRVVLAGLTTRGNGPVLLTLPSAELPAIAGGFTIGGAIDGGVLARAAAEGFVILGIMAVCGAFNAVVDHHQLLRLVPRAYAEMGVALSVAIAFVPEFITAASTAAEADRARTGGVTVRRGRIRRLAGPIVERALDQAIALAESMDSRGFGRDPASSADRRATAAGVAGLLAIAAGLAVLTTGESAVAAALVAVGALVVGGGVIAASRSSKRTRHRVLKPTRRDLALALVVVAAPALLVALGIAGDGTLRWLADDTRWPPSTALPILAIALLAAPAYTGRAPR